MRHYLILGLRTLATMLMGVFAGPMAGIRVLVKLSMTTVTDNLSTGSRGRVTGS